MDLLDQTEADHLRRHARRQRRPRVERPVTGLLDRIARLAQRDFGPVAERHRDFLIGDAHAPLAGKAGHGEVLQLPAVDRIGEIQHRMVGDRRFPPRRLGRAGEAQEHRGGVAIALGRVAAPVLQMTALAGARVEQRAEPVGRLRRGGRRHPEFPEQRVAELERALFLEGDVGRGMREGVLVGPLLRRAGAALHQLEPFGLGKILRRPGDGLDAGEVLGVKVGAGGRDVQVAGNSRTGQQPDGQQERMPILLPTRTGKRGGGRLACGAESARARRMVSWS